MDFVSVYITTPHPEEARRLAHTLVSERLAACVNIVENVLSMYEWEGRVQEERECVLFAKTRDDRFDALRERVLELHSYDCPCIVELTVPRGHAPYLDWVTAQTRAGGT